MRAATSTPRSARISSSSSSSTRRGVELALRYEVGDRAADRRRGALQAAGEALPPALFGGVIHAGRRDSGFGMDAESAGKVFDPRTRPRKRWSRACFYRDGLMLVIDKPAGLSVHRGPKGGAEPGGLFRRAALRPAARARAGAPARPRDLRLPGARPPPQGARALEPAVQAPPRRQDLLGGGRGRPGGGRADRHAARPARPDARLVDEARSGRPAGGDEMEGDGACRRPRASPGWRSSRSPAARISCACIAPRWACRSSATTSTATAPRRAGQISCMLHAREIVVPLYTRSASRSP